MPAATELRALQQCHLLVELARGSHRTRTITQTYVSCSEGEIWTDTNPALEVVLCPGDIAMPKKRIDVVLAGSFRFPAPIEETLVRLEVGQRVNKEMRIFGDRFWLPGLTDSLAASRPRPMTELPIVWERSSGGAAQDERKPADRRNPAGRPGGSPPAI
jgi:hypothetical protein